MWTRRSVPEAVAEAPRPPVSGGPRCQQLLPVVHRAVPVLQHGAPELLFSPVAHQPAGAPRVRVRARNAGDTLARSTSRRARDRGSFYRVRPDDCARSRPRDGSGAAEVPGELAIAKPAHLRSDRAIGEERSAAGRLGRGDSYAAIAGHVVTGAGESRGVPGLERALPRGSICAGSPSCLRTNSPAPTWSS